MFNYYSLFILNGRAEKNLRICSEAIPAATAAYLELYKVIASRVDEDRGDQSAKRNCPTDDTRP